MNENLENNEKLEPKKEASEGQSKENTEEHGIIDMGDRSETGINDRPVIKQKPKVIKK